MPNILLAADYIFNSALQVLSELQVEPSEIPLIMAAATQRLDHYALSSMAQEIQRLQAAQADEPADEQEQPESEAYNG